MMYWELVRKVVDTDWCPEDDEDQQYQIQTEIFDNFRTALAQYIKDINTDSVSSIVVYAHVNSYPTSIVLGYSDDWNDNFITDPDWVE